VNSSQGGGSKDTWVLDGGRAGRSAGEAADVVAGQRLAMAMPAAASAPEMATITRQTGPDQ